MEREQSWRGASTGLGWRGGESSVLFLLPDGWNLHSQPPSIYQRLWWCCRGTGTQSRRGAHLLHHPRWHCGVREKHNPLFFQPLCCCIALLQQFLYYGMLPSNCPPLRCSFPHVPWSYLRSVSPGWLSNSTTVFIKSEVKVAQSCPTLCDPMDYTVHGILQARTLEFWVAFPFSRGSSQLRYWTQVSLIAVRFFTSWATWEAHLLKRMVQIQAIHSLPLLIWENLSQAHSGAKSSSHSIVNTSTVFPTVG